MSCSWIHRFHFPTRFQLINRRFRRWYVVECWQPASVHCDTTSVDNLYWGRGGGVTRNVGKI